MLPTRTPWWGVQFRTVDFVSDTRSPHAPLFYLFEQYRFRNVPLKIPPGRPWIWSDGKGERRSPQIHSQMPIAGVENRLKTGGFRLII